MRLIGRERTLVMGVLNADLGTVTARPLEARVYATISAILAGADVVRVHDVRAMVDAVRRLKESEAGLGRTPGPRYGPRTIDLDLLLYARSSTVVTDGDVVVPHVRLAERRFALAPLCELAPDEREPRSGLTVRELLGAVEDQPARVLEHGAWWKTASS